MDPSKKDKQQGLHKEISSIFDGVPVPNGGVARISTGSPKPIPGTDHQAGATESADPGKTRQKTSGSVNSKPDNPMPSGSKSKPTSRPRPAASVKVPSTGLVQQIKEKLFSSDPDNEDAKRQKIMAMLIPLLAVILTVVLFKVITGGPSRSRAKTPEAPQATARSESTTAEVLWEPPAPYAPTTRDPMKTGTEQINQTAGGATGTTGVKQNELEVTGILYSADNPMALVDGHILRIGDTIQGATVVGIDQNSVRFERDGNHWEQDVRE